MAGLSHEKGRKRNIDIARPSIVIATLLLSAMLFDDGWIGTGGVPKLMTAHPSIHMDKEIVDVYISRKITKVDARFWFRNDGPATSVRIGFPDENSSSDDKPVLKDFKSTVNGKAVRTKFESERLGYGWHIKTVPFPAKKTLEIRNTYLCDTSFGRVGPPDSWKTDAGYILHTGASWKDPIGDALVRLHFAKDLQQPTTMKTPWSYRVMTESTAGATALIKKSGHFLYWSGPCKPTLSKGVLTFHRKSFEPTENDDINITFDIGMRHDSRAD